MSRTIDLVIGHGKHRVAEDELRDLQSKICDADRVVLCPRERQLLDACISYAVLNADGDQAIFDAPGKEQSAVRRSSGTNRS